MSIVPVVPFQTDLEFDNCAAAVPWDCAFGWIPLIGAPVAFSQRCREAYDLEKACNAGGFGGKRPNVLPGSGAGSAPDLAANPGVQYSDPNVLRTIQEQQAANDKVKWFQTIDANRRLIEGAADPSKDAEPEAGWVLFLALGVVVLGLFMVGGRR